MRKSLLFFILMVLSLDLLAQTPGKRESRYGFEVYYRPPVYYNFFIRHDPPEFKPVMYLQLSIQNDLFRFDKIDELYLAVYEVSVIIRNEAGETLFSEAWRREIRVAEFAKTNSKSDYQKDKKRFQPDLPSGNYRLYLEIMDGITGKGYRDSRSLTINPDIPHSDLSFSAAKDKQPSEIIIGSEPPIIEFNQDQLVSFDLSTPVRDSVIITSKLLKVTEESSPIVRQRIYRLLPGAQYFPFEEILEKKYLEEGNYLIKYRINYNQVITNLEKYFTIVWFEKPVYLYKYDLALRPMKYILTPEQWEEADALSYEELGKWMHLFWGAQDPSPDTPLNEIQVEFFNRVEQANSKYSQRFAEGWETDRGKALILYGKPDREESNRYAVKSKPYEIWYYDELKKKLTFMDEYKDDNYVLIAIEDIEDTDNEQD